LEGDDSADKRFPTGVVEDFDYVEVDERVAHIGEPGNLKVFLAGEQAVGKGELRHWIGRIGRCGSAEDFGVGGSAKFSVSRCEVVCKQDQGFVGRGVDVD